MDASFFSKPLSQLECRDNKKSCHLLEKKGTHPMRMHDNNTTCNRSNQNAGFLDTTNTTCNRSNQNARLPDTHSHSTNQHLATSDTTKTTCYRSAAQCWKAFLVKWRKQDLLGSHGLLADPLDGHLFYRTKEGFPNRLMLVPKLFAESYLVSSVKNFAKANYAC